MSLFPTYLNESDQQLLKDVIKYIKLTDGHDAYVNLRHHYGDKPWMEGERLITSLEKLTGAKDQ